MLLSCFCILIPVKYTPWWLSLLFLCFQPVSEEFQNGEGFGYIVAFRANGTRGWKEKMVTSADSTMYKYRDETFPPLTPFEVKVGVYNNKGDGPFSKVVIIHSAEGGKLIFMVVWILKTEEELFSPLDLHCCFTEPREAPSDVKAYGISSSEIRVTWKSPTPGPGKPRGYEVCINYVCDCFFAHFWCVTFCKTFSFLHFSVLNFY